MSFSYLHLVAAAILSAGLFVACAAAADETPATQPAMSAPTTLPAVAMRAEDVKPLKEGDHAPGGTLRKPDGSSVELASLISAKPTVLIFYRGGWCPYCSTHMGELAKIEPQLVALGYQILAIAPDSPESETATLAEKQYKYQLLSDTDVTVIRKYGLAFKVDDPTIDRYHGFGIDLVKASGGQTHHVLPVPAAYIVDTTGLIRFAHWNPDYRVRISGEDLVAAAKKVAEEKAE